MKKLLIFILLLSGACPLAFAQDIVTMRDGTEIEALVLEVNPGNIRYRKFSNPDGPVYTEFKSRILMIRYANGEKDIFTPMNHQIFQYGERTVPEGVHAGMPYKEYASLYRPGMYNRREPEYYNPSTAAILSYFVPGLGQMVCGEAVRGLCVGAATIGCFACAGAYGDFSHDTALIFGLATAGMWVWNIYDAQRVAKIKNMYLLDSQRAGRKEGVSTGSASRARIQVRLSAAATPGFVVYPSPEFVLDRPQTLYGIYGNLFVIDHCTPVYQVEVSRRMGERFTLGAALTTANGTGYTRGTDNANNIYKKRVHEYALTAAARYRYFSLGNGFVYGGGALGAGYRHIETSGGVAKKMTTSKIVAEYELVPIGINLTAGTTGFFIEGVTGSLANGCRIGINQAF